MSVRQSVLGEVAIHTRGQVLGVDLGSLVRRLLLFDTVVVQSVRLREIPFLVRSLGQSGFVQLFSTGVLKISCEFRAIIGAVSRNGIPAHPLCHFSFGMVDLTNREQALRKELRALQGIAGLKSAERQILEETIITGLSRPGLDYGSELQAQVESDIRNNTPALRLAIETQLSRQLGLPHPRVEVRIEEPESRVFHIKTDLPRVYGLSEQKTHDILESCVHAVAVIDQRVADMAAYSSISSFSESEAPLLFGKFAGIIAPQNPEPIERQFGRVITLANLPELAPGKTVDVEKLLQARESAECREFRSWLAGLEDLSDEQLAEMIRGLRVKVGSLMSSNPGKVLRLAVTTALGAIPGAGLIVGPIAGAIDTFLVDKVFPSSGAVAFLTETYPSLFDRAQ